MVIEVSVSGSRYNVEALDLRSDSKTEAEAELLSWADNNGDQIVTMAEMETGIRQRFFELPDVGLLSPHQQMFLKDESRKEIISVLGSRVMKEAQDKNQKRHPQDSPTEEVLACALIVAFTYVTGGLSLAVFAATGWGGLSFIDDSIDTEEIDYMMKVAVQQMFMTAELQYVPYSRL